MQFTLKSCIRWVSCLLAAALQSALFAQTVHISHCLAGCPIGAPAANEIVVRHLYAASINYQTGMADWVAYRVLPGTVGVASLLLREWQVDELLTREQDVSIENAPRFVQPDISNLQDRDYRINEVIINPEDRGRLAPMSSFAGTPYWYDLNYLSNMAPVPVALRLGPWSRLDQAVNELTARIGEVFVVSGPLVRGMEQGDTIAGSAAGPAAFFKFIATDAGHVAFVFPAASARHSGFCDKVVGLAQLQQSSGFNLLPGMSASNDIDLYGMLGCHLDSE